MEFLALGPLQVVDDDGEIMGIGGARRRMVLASLLVRAGEAVSVDRIAANVWGEDIPANPKSAIQVAVSRLRSTIGPDRIQARGSGYLLRVGPDELDTQVFEGFALEGRRAAERDQRDSAVELYDRALALWRGPAYGEFEYDDFARGEIQRLTEIRSTIIEARLQLLIESGRQSEALPEIEALLAGDPLRENVWALYMLALYRSGRQADALRAYQRASETLGEELGIEPSRELRHLEEQILLQAEELEPDEDLVATGLPEGEVTFLVADGGAATGEAAEDEVAAAFANFDSTVRAGGGAVFRSTADQRFAVFIEPAAAVGAAADVQIGKGKPMLAMGIHTTQARLQSGDYVGLGVSRAIRVAVAAAPGQVLMTQAAVEAIGTQLPPEAAVRELPPRVLPGLSSPETVAELSHPQLTTVEAPRPAPTNLPAEQLSSFVGRSLELREVEKLIDEHRLITLTGPGGVGKTRLALQVASDQVGRHTDGVWLVELAAVDSRELIVDSIAEVMNVEPNGQSAMEALLGRLSGLSCLIVLDNCEHVVDEVAEVAAELLPSSGTLRIVATSRERLGITGERVFPVPRLAVPALADSLDPTELEDYEAVHLFSTRARAVDSTFEVDSTNATSVVSICRRVDGIPLAIELAAAQVGVLQPQEIAGRLEEGFQLLDTGRRRGRQATLQAAIDWSYRLLDEQERRVLQAASIFEGGFDLDAAEVVCKVAEFARPTVDVIASLVRKSLVTARPSGGVTHYELLETIRAFAREKCDGERWLALGEDHAAYFAAMASHEAMRLEGGEAVDALARLRRNADNLRAALGWFSLHDPAAGVAMVTRLPFFIKLGLAAEGARLAEAVFDAYDGGETLELADAKRVGGSLAYSAGAVQQGLLRWEESARIAQDLGDPVGQARTLNNMAILTITAEGRLAEGAVLLRQALEALPEDAEPWLAVSIVGNLAVAEFKLGNLEQALSDMEAHYALAQRVGVRTDEARALGNMGLALWCLGRLTEAEEKLNMSIKISREVGDSEFLSEPLKVLAEVYIATGRLTAAAEMALEALELRTSAYQSDVPDFVETIGGLAIARDDYALGVRLIGAARAAKGRPDSGPVAPEEKARQPLVNRAQEALGDAFDDEWAAGGTMSEAEAVELARDVAGAGPSR